MFHVTLKKSNLWRQQSRGEPGPVPLHLFSDVGESPPPHFCHEMQQVSTAHVCCRSQLWALAMHRKALDYEGSSGIPARASFLSEKTQLNWNRHFFQNPLVGCLWNVPMELWPKTPALQWSQPEVHLLLQWRTSLEEWRLP